MTELIVDEKAEVLVCGTTVVPANPAIDPDDVWLDAALDWEETDEKQSNSCRAQRRQLPDVTEIT